MKVTGFVFVICGVLSILFPLIAGIALEFFYGAILTVVGAAAFVHAAKQPSRENRLTHYLLALVFVACGLLLLLSPLTGLMAFTLLIAITFITQGIAQLIFGLRNRSASNHIWVTLSGILGLSAGVMIIIQWPSSANWVIGMLAGINLMMVGTAILTAPSHTELDAI